MAKNQLATLTPEIESAFQPQVLEVIRTSICPTATDAEFMLFAHKAASYGLDPFKNEIFFIKYGTQARIQFAAEAYLSKAREKEGFQPPDTQVVCANDEFKAKKTRGEDGKDEWEVLEHEVSFPRGPVVGAYSIAYRDGYRPVTVFVDKEHIAHVYTGQNKDNWQKWEPDMIGKHAEQRALKKQYGLEFGDEVDRQPQVEGYDPSGRTDVTPPAASPEPEIISPGGKDGSPQAAAAPTDEERLKQARAQMKRNFTQLGITEPEAMASYIEEKAKPKGDKPTLKELTGLLKIMDLDIAEKLAAQKADDELPS